MSAGNFPKGAGLGRDPNPKSPTLIDYEWVMQHGNRAQRREILRSLKLSAREQVPGASEALAALKRYAEHRTSLAWRVSLPGREPFTVICPQRPTAHEILNQWPGAVVEACDGD